VCGQVHNGQHHLSPLALLRLGLPLVEGPTSFAMESFPSISKSTLAVWEKPRNQVAAAALRIADRPLLSTTLVPRLETGMSPLAHSFQRRRLILLFKLLGWWEDKSLPGPSWLRSYLCHVLLPFGLSEYAKLLEDASQGQPAAQKICHGAGFTLLKHKQWVSVTSANCSLSSICLPGDGPPLPSLFRWRGCASWLCSPATFPKGHR